MDETLLAGSTIWLFGRVMKDITLDGKKTPAKPDGQLAGALKQAEAKFARIYSFAFEGNLITLAKPAIFLVHGDGDKIEDKTLAGIGLAITAANFAQDFKIWQYERDDITLRLDPTSGTFGRVLIQQEVGKESLQDYVRGGADVGTPTSLGAARRPRSRLFRSDDE
ncbi:hypothetical protein [Amaricoccus sp. W119]|uniref:hypothetical protein n=1 Tax=Amaricoccus sp. W119 TaxID=3391833 RepID=UPI0039A70F76